MPRPGRRRRGLHARLGSQSRTDWRRRQVAQAGNQHRLDLSAESRARRGAGLGRSGACHGSVGTRLNLIDQTHKVRLIDQILAAAHRREVVRRAFPSAPGPPRRPAFSHVGAGRRFSGVAYGNRRTTQAALSCPWDSSSRARRSFAIGQHQLSPMPGGRQCFGPATPAQDRWFCMCHR